jgi:2-oxoglutarate dehydrogenase E1 component
MGSMTEFLDSSTLFGSNAPFIEELYDQYLANPARRQRRMEGLFRRAPRRRRRRRARPRDRVVRRARPQPQGRWRHGRLHHDAQAGARAAAHQQVPHAGRVHPPTSIRCSGRTRRTSRTSTFGPYQFTEGDMETEFDVGSLKTGPARMRLKDIITALAETYCGTFGVEYMYISDTPTKRFVQQRIEPIRSRPDYTPEQRRHILERLTAAETLERYLHTKYVGQKRFSGEGGDSLIPMLDLLVQKAGTQGVGEIVMGMAHRGRLNVLVNTLGKMPADLFSEFEGKGAQDLPAGDVKYHQGFSSDVSTPGGPGAPHAGVQSVAPGDREPRWSRAACARASIAARIRRATRCCPC